MLLNVLPACLVSRTERPLITGFVYDQQNNKPIEGCKVGEAITDARGYYSLKEKRYREFTLPGFEARPVLVVEYVEKEGYVPDTLFGYNPHGGGLKKGIHWEMDTVFLKERFANPINHN